MSNFDKPSCARCCRISSAAGGSPCHGAPREINGSWDVEGMLGMTGENQAEQQVEINHT
jgi:hypothetical protein